MADKQYRAAGFSLWLKGLRLAHLARPAQHQVPPIEIRAPGLRAAVMVERDLWGVPRIIADNMEDTLFAQGFLHARERAFQMDLTRRLALGELAERLGPSALPSDRFMRQLNFRHWADVSTQTWSDNVRRYVDAYARGVNHAWQTLAPASEFLALKYRPSPWTAADCNLIMLSMGWLLTSMWRTKWAYHTVADDPDLRAWLFGPLDGPPSPTVCPGTGSASAFGGASLGSNGWVLSGRFTQSGQPLLASDPHLPLSFPGPWYQMALEGGALHAFGATVPGGPGVILGQNQDIAWGVTNIDADNQDLYQLRLNADDRQYQVAGQTHTLSERVETIAVRGAPSHRAICYDSHLGPVIMGPSHGEAVALAWTGFAPLAGVQSTLRLNRASDWETFNLALADWGVPALSFLYADRSGHIGYVAAGRFPDRPANAQSWRLLDGNRADMRWKGIVHWQDHPRLFDPPEGMIVSANNPLVGDHFTPHFGGRYSLGYRADQILAQISRSRVHTAQTLAAIQTDLHSRPLLDLAVKLQGEPALPPRWKAILTSFDGTVSTQAIAPTLLYGFAMAAVPPQVQNRLSQPVFPAEVPPLHPTTFWTYLGERLVPAVLTHWTDLDVTRAIAQAESQLRRDLGEDWQKWHWGRAHYAQFAHPLAPSRLVGPLYQRLPVAMPGDYYSPHQASFTSRAGRSWPRRVQFAPSYRQILDLGRPDQSQALLWPGQSGDPASAHSDDLIQDFLANRLHPCGPGMDTEEWMSFAPPPKPKP